MTGSYNSLLYIYLYTYIYLFISQPGVYRTSRYVGPCECYRCIDSQRIRREQKYHTSSCLDESHQGNYSSDVRTAGFNAMIINMYIFHVTFINIQVLENTSTTKYLNQKFFGCCVQHTNTSHGFPSSSFSVILSRQV